MFTENKSMDILKAFRLNDPTPALINRKLKFIGTGNNDVSHSAYNNLLSVITKLLKEVNHCNALKNQ